MNPKLRPLAIGGGLSLLACVAILGEQGGLFSEHQPLVFIVVVAVAAVLGLVWYGSARQVQPARRHPGAAQP